MVKVSCYPVRSFLGFWHCESPDCTATFEQGFWNIKADPKMAWVLCHLQKRRIRDEFACSAQKQHASSLKFNLRIRHECVPSSPRDCAELAERQQGELAEIAPAAQGRACGSPNCVLAERTRRARTKHSELAQRTRKAHARAHSSPNCTLSDQRSHWTLPELAHWSRRDRRESVESAHTQAWARGSHNCVLLQLHILYVIFRPFSGLMCLFVQYLNS